MEQDLKVFADELHKRVTSKYQTRTINVNGKNDIWGADLNDMITYKDANDGYCYIFVIEDIYTRKAWAYPLKDKKARTIADKLQQLFHEVTTTPKYLWTDKGGEFYNNIVDKLLKKNNIHLYSVYGASKVANVERLNQTLKNIMFKILTARQSHNWISILDDVLLTYNNAIHSGIGTTPNKAYKNPKLVKNNNLINDELLPFYNDDDNDKTATFKLGDYVRISRLKGTFEKGYEENWTREVFQIVVINHTDPVTYKLNDLQREPIDGSFYANELQVTTIPFFALINKVIKRKIVKGKKLMFVSWSGYSDKFDTWINDEQSNNINT